MLLDVCLLKCEDYMAEELDRALEEAAELAGFPDVEGKTILVKPNLLRGVAPEKAVTTHPEFLAAVLRLLKKLRPARVLVGDSPGWQKGSAAARPAGLLAATQDGGAQWVDMDSGAMRAAPRGRLVKEFYLASVLQECDLIVNLPKLKTHQLMTYTGATKNLFGLIPGLGKSGMHLRFPNARDFGTMLVDLSSCLPPVFTFMDSIVAMEGEGPGNGTPRHTGFLLASHNPAALDWVAASCIGYDPQKIPYLVDAFARSQTGNDSTQVSPDSLLIGPLQISDVLIKDFKLLPYATATAQKRFSLNQAPAPIKRLANMLLVSRPIFHAEKCIGCSACVNICPAKALALGKDSQGRHKVRIDDSVCITCYCCHEVCPASAISIGRVLHRRREDSRKAERTQ